MSGGRRVSAFGLDVQADFDIPGTVQDAAGLGKSLFLKAVPATELEPLLGQPRILRDLNVFDGSAYVMLEGADGDVLFSYGRRALFHLSADRQVLRCAPFTSEHPSWKRVLLDTILWTVSWLRGFELLHASAVGTAAGIVAFVAVSGGGKTTLAAEYLKRGAPLFCDDILALEEAGDQVLAYPGPPLVNLPRKVEPSSVGAADVIAEFDDERWVSLGTQTPAAEPLAAVVLMNRAQGETARCTQIDGTSLALLPHAVYFPHVAARERARFELFGTVAGTTPLLSLTADPSVPGATLADLVGDRIDAQ
jgi:hypothetical protein